MLGYLALKPNVFAFGAGGMGNGLEAASTFVALVKQRAKELRFETDCERFLKQADYAVSLGETTGMVLVLESGEFVGASVGDSSAKILSDTQVTDIT